MTEVVIIAAVAANGVIGADNKLPWKLPEDLKRFKALTTGHAILMGRKTWESLGRPLPNRHNIVLTRSPDYLAAGAVVVGSLHAAFVEAEKHRDDCLFVIGGADIYRQTLKSATRLELTEVKVAVPGDTFFPDIDWADWQETTREPHLSDLGMTYDFVTYCRMPPRMRAD